MRVGSLRDELFLIAHDDTGRLIGAEPGISAGLAGATLIDLLLHGRVAVVDGRLDVIDSASTGDDESDATLMAIAANSAPTGPRAWVSWISDRAYERTAKSLEAAGVIHRTTTRRLGLVAVTRSAAGQPGRSGPTALPPALRAALERPARRGDSRAMRPGTGFAAAVVAAAVDAEFGTFARAGTDGRRQHDHGPPGDQGRGGRDHRRYLPLTHPAAPPARRVSRVKEQSGGNGLAGRAALALHFWA